MNMQDPRFICGSVCKDAHHASTKVSEARQLLSIIARHLNQSPHSVRANARLRTLFHTHVKCRYVGNTCSKLMQEERELSNVESQLEQAFNNLIEYMKDLKTSNLDAYNTVKHDLLRRLSGQYPKAWQTLNRN